RPESSNIFSESAFEEISEQSGGTPCHQSCWASFAQGPVSTSFEGSSSAFSWMRLARPAPLIKYGSRASTARDSGPSAGGEEQFGAALGDRCGRDVARQAVVRLVKS